MQVDLARVASINKQFVQKWWRETGKDDPASAIGIMASATYVECIIVAYWLGEEAGYPDWLKKSVDNLMQFYGYTEILNKPEDCPW